MTFSKQCSRTKTAKLETVNEGISKKRKTHLRCDIPCGKWVIKTMHEKQGDIYTINAAAGYCPIPLY